MTNILEEYFNYYKQYKSQYNKCFVLMQKGSFFESYYYNDIKNKKEYGYPLHEICNILNILLSKADKSKETTKNNPQMAGFPCVSLHKYLKVLIDHSFTVVLVEQYDSVPRIKRKVTNIYSPGTYIDNIVSDTNYILSIYINEEKQLYSNDTIICIGLVLIELSLGECIFNEILSTKYDDKIAIDETIKFINSFNPREIIIYHNKQTFSKLNEQQLINILEINNNKYQYYDKINPELFKINMQEMLLNKIFKKENNMLSMIEYLNLERYEYARMCLLLLLEFISIQNSELIKNIKIPIEYQNKLYLNYGNETIYQLNVLNYSNNKSLFNILNYLSTSLGRRYLKNALMCPLINSSQINERYLLMEKLENNNLYLQIQKLLKNILDIERLHRKISLKSIHPVELYNLVCNFKDIYSILKILKQNNINILNNIEIIENFKKYINYLNSIFTIDELQKFLINDINSNIFKNDIFSDIDEITYKINNNKKQMDIILNNISDIIDIKDDLFEGKKQLFAKIEYNDRDNYYILVTKKRGELLKKKLNKTSIPGINVHNIEYITRTDTIKLIIPEFKKLSDELVILENNIKKIIKKNYLITLESIYNEYNPLINDICKIISYLDFLINGIIVYKKYNYHKPTIVEKDYSYIKTKQLRHPIIEQINKLEQYNPHDFTIGINDYGILLYGVNSAGKSSLMKSIGLNLILAQIGYYTASDEFIFSPYKNLFTRISNNDNLYKNQSSFTYEMLELQSILKRSGPCTLVLADELASSTEVYSGNVIIMTMIEMLLKSKTNFISATHFHEIYTYNRFKNLQNLKILHIDVKYDHQKNQLIYSRELKEGPGTAKYGLLVAKYIIHDKLFNDITAEIEKDIYNVSLVPSKKSKYNSNLFLSKCVVCGIIPKYNEIPLESHHIIEQKNADKNGFINHFHKNNLHNLVSLCSKCHDLVDKDYKIQGYKYTSSGIQLVIEKN